MKRAASALFVGLVLAAIVGCRSNPTPVGAYIMTQYGRNYRQPYTSWYRNGADLGADRNICYPDVIYYPDAYFYMGRH